MITPCADLASGSLPGVKASDQDLPDPHTYTLTPGAYSLWRNN